MDVDSYQRVRHRLAIVDSEVPDFKDVKNGLYLSDQEGKGNIVYIHEKSIRVKFSDGKEVVIPDTFVIDETKGIILGVNSGEKITEGCDNILIGKNIGKDLLESHNNIALGNNTLANSSSIGESIAIGSNALGECGNSEMNIGIGKDALENINDGYNIGIGIGAGSNMAGLITNHNILIGRESMKDVQDTAIGVIAIGASSASNMSGNNFRSVYIGDKVAHNLCSPVVSVNNVGIGSQVLADAKNVSDCVVLGSETGRSITGVKSILVGFQTANNSNGTLNEEIIIGSLAGANRLYQDSRNIFMGSSAGHTGSGCSNIGLGNFALANSDSDQSIAIGYKCGQHSQGSNNLLMGHLAGESLTGDMNICLGEKAGNGMIGSKNICLGGSSQLGDILNESVIIGDGIFAKGQRAVVIGSSAGKMSTGFMNREILIGFQAGQGQKYNEDENESRNLLLIGSCAGYGDPSNPENINSGDLVCLGHNAGRSDEQSFQRTVIIGNNAGSFAGHSSDSVVMGHNAGIGMCGDRNICLGSSAGTNLKGDGNIILGHKAGQGTISEKLVIGNDQRTTLFADLEGGNIVIGNRSNNLSDWLNGEGTLAFMDVVPPKNINTVGGVLYGNSNHLFYMTPNRQTNLTFPYKFSYNGFLNGLSFRINTKLPGSSLLNINIIPHTDISYYFTSKIILNVDANEEVVVNLDDPNWGVEIKDDILTFSTNKSITGIFYMEVIGEHIVKQI